MSYSFPCIKAPSNACNTRRKLHMKTVKLVCSAPMYHEQYEVITNKKVRTITCPDHKLLPWHLQFFCLHYIPERKQSLGCLQSHFPDIFPYVSWKICCTATFWVWCSISFRIPGDCFPMLSHWSKRDGEMEWVRWSGKKSRLNYKCMGSSLLCAGLSRI